LALLLLFPIFLVLERSENRIGPKEAQAN